MGELRHRRRMRRKRIQAVASAIEDALGCPVFGPEDEVDEAEFRGARILLVRGTVMVLYVDARPFLTVRGLIAYSPKRLAVTVDMGAVPFVYNGADVMAPGVVDADPSVEDGGPCWVRDERNQTPLAVGTALTSGGEMIRQQEGKVIRTAHWVGDRLWSLGERP